MPISLDARRFRAIAHVAGGEVGSDTVFEYHQESDLVWARYTGGSVRLGYLVGTRDGDAIEFRYSQVNVDGETSNGHCRSTLHLLADGRLQLRETWEWESRPGSGTSVVEEISP